MDVREDPPGSHPLLQAVGFEMSSSGERQPIPGETANIVNQEHVRSLIALQIETMKHLRQSREVMSDFNRTYEQQQSLLQKKFAQHAKLLRRLSSDFQDVFVRIRRCRQKIDQAIGRPVTRSWDLEEADEDWTDSSEDDQVFVDAKGGEGAEEAEDAEADGVEMDSRRELDDHGIIQADGGNEGSGKNRNARNVSENRDGKEREEEIQKIVPEKEEDAGNEEAEAKDSRNESEAEDRKNIDPQQPPSEEEIR